MISLRLHPKGRLFGTTKRDREGERDSHTTRLLLKVSFAMAAHAQIPPQSSFTVLLEELEMSVDLHTRIELQRKGWREWAE